MDHVTIHFPYIQIARGVIPIKYPIKDPIKDPITSHYQPSSGITVLATKHH